MRLKVRKNGFELSDSLFLTGSRINTEFLLGAQVKTGPNCLRKQPNGFYLWRNKGRSQFL
jgi:hypothetical protein